MHECARQVCTHLPHFVWAIAKTNASGGRKQVIFLVFSKYVLCCFFVVQNLLKVFRKSSDYLRMHTHLSMNRTRTVCNAKKKQTKQTNSFWKSSWDQQKCWCIVHWHPQNKPALSFHVWLNKWQHWNDRSLHANWNCNRANANESVVFRSPHHTQSLSSSLKKMKNPSKIHGTFFFFCSKPEVAFLSNEHTPIWEVIRKRQRIVKSCFMQISFCLFLRWRRFFCVGHRSSSKIAHLSHFHLCILCIQ